MTNPFESENGEYLVLVNDEGQFSLWPAHRDIPPGWKETGQEGTRGACLAWVEKNWTDPRPRALESPEPTRDPGAG